MEPFDTLFLFLFVSILLFSLFVESRGLFFQTAAVSAVLQPFFIFHFLYFTELYFFQLIYFSLFLSAYFFQFISFSLEKSVKLKTGDNLRCHMSSIATTTVV